MHIYGGRYADGAWSLSETSDGGYVVIGYTVRNDTDLWVLKLNSRGEIEWARTYGGPGDDMGYGIDEVEGGGFIAVGTTDSFGPGGEKLWVLRLDESGDLIWDKVLGGLITDGEAGWSVRDSGDGFVIAGSTRSFGAGGKDLWMIKMDRDGEVLWSKAFGLSQDDVGFSVASTPFGYIAAGYCTESGNENVYLVMTDHLGSEIWNRSFGGTGSDAALSMIPSGDGFVLVGRTETNRGDRDILLARISEAGDLLWWRSFGGEGDQVGMAVAESDDGYIVAGRSGLANDWSMILVVTDSNGVPLASYRLGRGIATSLTYGGDECVVAGTMPSGDIEQEDLFIASFRLPLWSGMPVEVHELQINETGVPSAASIPSPPNATVSASYASPPDGMLSSRKSEMGSKSFRAMFRL
ncbi:hypothetical protein Mthe_0738 [Methanothrix thermoacetophila PT]|uniref:Uncharacterized protein n=2 Tax=Methanotrichaceae TaxID=143067 RepID=A0B754_METTP|nr:hypothetical protein Mthe_0738 [Methanothrix thermoacetophila PT]